VTFRKKVLPPSLWLKGKPGKYPARRYQAERIAHRNTVYSDRHCLLHYLRLLSLSSLLCRLVSEPRSSCAIQSACSFSVVCYLACSLTLNMVAAHPSETWVNVYQFSQYQSQNIMPFWIPNLTRINSFEHEKLQVITEPRTNSLIAEWVSCESCSCEKWEASTWGRGKFGNPDEWERPPLKPLPSNG
jgi:hypothetical protein